jgi:hypothetical protein
MMMIINNNIIIINMVTKTENVFVDGIKKIIIIINDGLR